MKWHDITFWEQAYIDLWSIPHFIIGVIIAFGSVFLGISHLNGFIIAVVITIGWEIFEYVFKIPELFTNRIMDILVALIGFGIVIWAIKHFDLSDKSIQVWLTIVIVIFLLTNIIGWLAYKHYSA